jgi:hypothetical protein
MNETLIRLLSAQLRSKSIEGVWKTPNLRESFNQAKEEQDHAQICNGAAKPNNSSSIGINFAASHHPYRARALYNRTGCWWSESLPWFLLIQRKYDQSDKSISKYFLSEIRSFWR